MNNTHEIAMNTINSKMRMICRATCHATAQQAFGGILTLCGFMADCGTMPPAQRAEIVKKATRCYRQWYKVNAATCPDIA